MADEKKPGKGEEPLSPSQEIAAGAPPSARLPETAGEELPDWRTRTGGPHTESRYNPATDATVREVDRRAGKFHGSSTPDNVETTEPPKRGR